MNEQIVPPPFPQIDTLELQRVWSSLQTIMQGLYRWKRFREVNPLLRKQDLNQHSLSLTFLGASFLPQLMRYPELASLDTHLFLTTFVVHDVGEGLLERDVSLTEKGTRDDVDEYVAFRDFIAGLPVPMQVHLRRAFLLQFALDEEKWSSFDDVAWSILQDLSKTRRQEAIIFTVVEHYDYLMYMIEGYRAGDSYLLYEALKTEIKVWPRLKELCPAFGTVMLTPELEAWFMEFRRQYELQGGETRSTKELQGST